MNTPDPYWSLEMARASAAAYAIGEEGRIEDPSRIEALGLAETPLIHATHAGDPNAALIYERGDAVVLAFAAALPLPMNEGPGNFRVSLFDWLSDARIRQVPSVAGGVNRGFANNLEDILPSVVPDLRTVLDGEKSLFLCGHGKGGALATLAALELQEREGIPVAGVYTYGAPRVGDPEYAYFYTSRVPHWRFERGNDMVPHLPPSSGLWSLLAQYDDRLTEIAAFYEYASVGRLAYITSGGRLQAEPEQAFGLLARRLMTLGHDLMANELLGLRQDHDVDEGYIAPLEALLPE